MVGKISTALAAILLLGSVGIASARTVQRYDGVSNSHQDEMFCYVPSELSCLVETLPRGTSLTERNGALP
jgi:hypothetical protein